MTRRRTVPRIPPVGVPISVTREKRGRSVRVRIRWTVAGEQVGISKSFKPSEYREAEISQFIENLRMSKRTRTVPNLTFSEFCTKVGNDAIYEGLAPTTAATYRGSLKNQLLPILADTEIREIDTRKVRRVARSIQSDSSRGNSLNLLSRICRIAIDLGYLQSNPVSTAEARRRTAPRTIRKIIRNDRDAEQIFTAVERYSPRYADVLRVTLGCALRIGEAAALEVGDYDSQTHLLHVFKQIDSSGRKRPPKYGTSRHVPVNRETHEILIKWEENRLKGEPLFSTNGKGYVSTSTLRKITRWNQVVKEQGYEGLHIHDLRHTGLTTLCRKLAAAGEPLTVIKDIAGHRSTSTTESYIHTVEDDMQRAAQHLWD